MKLKASSLFGFFILLLNSPSKAQIYLPVRLDTLFENVSFDAFPVSSNSSFQGKPIDSTNLAILKKSVPDSYSIVFFQNISALQKFKLSNSLQGYLIHYDSHTPHTWIELFVFDKNGGFIEREEIAGSFSHEIGSTTVQSWITDLNNDGAKDIITKYDEGMNVYHQDKDEYIPSYSSTTILSIWTNNYYKEVACDSLLTESINKDFLFPRISFASTKHMERNFLKAGLTNYANWLIIAGSDKDLESAEFEIKRAKNIFSSDKSYPHASGLYSKLFDIYKKNNRYYTVLTFSSSDEVKEMLPVVKEKFNKTAYIVGFTEWCSEVKYNQQGDFFECK